MSGAAARMKVLSCAPPQAGTTSYAMSESSVSANRIGQLNQLLAAFNRNPRSVAVAADFSPVAVADSAPYVMNDSSNRMRPLNHLLATPVTSTDPTPTAVTNLDEHFLPHLVDANLNSAHLPPLKSQQAGPQFFSPSKVCTVASAAVSCTNATTAFPLFVATDAENQHPLQHHHMGLQTAQSSATAILFGSQLPVIAATRPATTDTLPPPVTVNSTSVSSSSTPTAAAHHKNSAAGATANNAAAAANSVGSNKPKTLVATPEQVMKLYMNKLTPYEHHEIFSYPSIYFIGAIAKKRQGSIGGSNNCGYDDEHGSYIQVLHDHVAYRYEVLKVIGKGSFGQVVKAYDHKTHQNVALKMVRNEKRFHRQAQEEIRILEHLRKQDKDNSMNIIHMFEHFTFRNHTCITFELLNINLYELIKKNKFQGFSLQLVRKFGHSLLQCLDALHRNRIIHCDLKPENVLLKHQGRSGIKVIDFGSSCYENQRVYTYIQSRFYRAPEVILGARYGLPIDMWSLGCILAELYTGYPLLPGEDEGDQLACTIELMGMPPPKLVEQSKRAKNFISSKGHPRYCTVTTLSDGGVVLNAGRSRRGKVRGPPASKDLTTALKGCNDQYFVDFLRRCLEWDPAQRLTPSAALRHLWFRRRLPRPPAPSSSSSSDKGDWGESPTRVISVNNHHHVRTVSLSGSSVVAKIGILPSAKTRQVTTISEVSSGLSRTKLPQITNSMT